MGLQKVKDTFLGNLAAPDAGAPPPSKDTSSLMDDEVLNLVQTELQRIVRENPEPLKLELELRNLQRRTGFNVTLLKKSLNQLRIEFENKQAAAAAQTPPPAPSPEQQTEAAAQAARNTALEARAAEIAKSNDIFKIFRKSLYRCKGYLANETLAGVILMSHAARLLPKSTGYLVSGASASGKSELIIKAAEFLPPEIVITATSFSDQALFYLGGIQHKYFVGGEMKIPKPGEPDDYFQAALRQLISDNKIVRMVVEKNEHGELTNVIKETCGPAAFMLTTTSESQAFNDEFINRLSVVYTDDSAAMTERVLFEQARGAAIAADADIEDDTDFEVEAWRTFNSRLKPLRVVIPYAMQLLPKNHEITMRRIFPLMLSYIRASALLHQASRELSPDGSSIAATLEDYKRAYEFINATAPRVNDLVSRKALEVRDKLRSVFFDNEFTRAEAQEHLRISEAAIQRILRALTKAGCLTLDTSGKHNTYKYKLTLIEPGIVDLGLTDPQLVKPEPPDWQVLSSPIEFDTFAEYDKVMAAVSSPTPCHVEI